MKKLQLNRRTFLKSLGLLGLGYVASSGVAKRFSENEAEASLFGEGTRNGPANVRQFGAAGDGKMVDTAAIQQAIDTLQQTGGGELYFPPGVYVIDSTLRISGNGVTLKGASMHTTVLASAPAPKAKTMLEIRNPGKRIAKINLLNLTVTSDPRIHNPAHRDGTTMTNGIVLDSCHGVYFDQVKVDHFQGDGLLFQDTINAGGPDQVVISNCTFVACRDGLNTNNTGHSTHIIGGTFEFNARYGINTGGRNSIFIKDADIEQNRGVGIRVSHLSNVVIRDCTFENNGRAYDREHTQKTHIWLGDFKRCQSVVIDSCYFHAKDMYSLIRLDQAKEISMTNNFVDLAGQFGSDRGCFVQVSPQCDSIYVDDFSYRDKPNVPRISDPQYAISAIRPSGVTSLPAATAAVRGFVVRLEGGSGVEDELYICVKTASGGYRWARLQT